VITLSVRLTIKLLRGFALKECLPPALFDTFVATCASCLLDSLYAYRGPDEVLESASAKTDSATSGR